MNDSRATWSLVCGIVGLLVCVPVAIPAIILGNQVKRDQGAAAPGTAKIGVILGWVAIALWVVALVVSLIINAT